MEMTFKKIIIEKVSGKKINNILGNACLYIHIHTNNNIPSKISQSKVLGGQGVRKLPLSHRDRLTISKRSSAQMYPFQVKKENNRYRIMAETKSNVNFIRKNNKSSKLIDIYIEREKKMALL